MNISESVKAWTGQVRTQGFDALWSRMDEREREEFGIFCSAMDKAFAMEAEHHWQDAADVYTSIGEKHPEWSDIAVARASYIVSEKLNRAIRYYNHGVRCVEQRQYGKALQYFDLALNIDQNMQIARYNLGMTHKIMYISDPAANKLSKISALDSFKALLSINPHHAKAAAQVEQLSKL